ncbi:MAG: DUF3788 domain-containing protein [Proteobacteria bacterium]|nr:DUF3788 domain-containing protein [Pseudomonadota bacterium]
MSLSIFGEKALIPDEKMLAEALADSKIFWNTIKDNVASVCGSITEEWKYYSKRAGWTLVVKSGKRTILYLVPSDGCFKVNFVFGEKAVAAAIDDELPKYVVALIMDAPQYVEGRPFMKYVETDADAGIVKKLIEIKHRN